MPFPLFAVFPPIVLDVLTGKFKRLPAGDELDLGATPIGADCVTSDFVNGDAGTINKLSPVSPGTDGELQLAIGTSYQLANVLGVVSDDTIASAATGTICGGGFITGTLSQWNAVLGNSANIAVSTITIADDRVVTAVPHRLAMNDPVQLTDAGSGTLPTGITFDTTYYAIIIDATTFQLALAPNADIDTAGTPIDLTGADSTGSVELVYQGAAPGRVYYVSASAAGEVTPTPPSTLGQFRKEVYTAITGTVAKLTVGETVEL